MKAFVEFEVEKCLRIKVGEWPLMTLKNLEFAIVGLGNISKPWMEAILFSDNTHLRCACDIDPAKQKLYPGIEFYNNVEKMLEHEDQLDAVIVNTPTEDHYKTGKIVLESGNNLVIEKPSTTNMDNFEDLVRVSKSSSVVMYNAFHFAFSKELNWFLDNYENLLNNFGTPLGFSSIFNDPYFINGEVPGKYSSLSGSWVDSGSNALSVLCKIFNAPDCVWSNIGNSVNNLIHDTTSHALIRCIKKEGGNIYGNIFTNWISEENYKITNILYDGAVVQLNHTQQSVEIKSGTKNSETIFKSADGDRLFNHYNGMIPDISEHLIHGNDNIEFAREVYLPLFGAFNKFTENNDARE